MKVLLIDTEVFEPLVRITDGGLEEWKRLLKCDQIDIQSRQVNGKYYDFICDNKALQAPKGKITALDKDGKPQLVGNLIICNYDGEGGEAGLTDDDIDDLLKQFVILKEESTEGEPERWLALNNVEY